MTVVEKVARSIFDATALSFWKKADLDGFWAQNDYDVESARSAARAAFFALHDSFADPVVRAAIQAALDEKEG